MKIAVEGCAHGELEIIYDSIKHLEEKENVKVDLLICCGDFQATRNPSDLKAMAVPQKYQSMCSFYKYYSGEKVAPMLTIFIGGNHEASNHLQELPYGGWAAPNIYYMGYANVLNIGGVRVAGLSGIYKGHDYLKGHFEKPPYSEDTKRSVYHIRNLEHYRLKQIHEPIDIFLSHDWPRGVHKYGDENQLVKMKPFFRDDIQSNSLGSRPSEELLHHLKPSYWFSAHLHVKFAALIPHSSDGPAEARKSTKFLALDKCLPKRKFLQIVDVPHDSNKAIELEYDLEWLSILHLTNHLLNVEKNYSYMPGPGSPGRWIFTPSPEELDFINEKFGRDLKVPQNFIQTAEGFNGISADKIRGNSQPTAQVNPQTKAFCEQLGIDDPIALLLKNDANSSFNTSNVSSYTLPGYLTPERPGDLTQVSFDESSEILEDGEDSEGGSPVKSNTSTPLSKKRISLILPTPVNDSSDLNRNEEETDASSKLGDLSGKDDTETKDADNSFNEETTPSNLSELSPIGKTNAGLAGEDDKNQPKVKKFRRRNQSLYTDVDEDG